MFVIEVSIGKEVQAELCAEFDRVGQAVEYGLDVLRTEHAEASGKIDLENLPDYTVKLTDKEEDLWLWSVSTNVLQGINKEESVPRCRKMPDCFGTYTVTSALLEPSCPACPKLEICKSFTATRKAEAEAEAKVEHKQVPHHKKLIKKVTRKKRIREIITQDWLHKDVVVFDRYMFAVPVRGRVIDVASIDGAVKVNFDKNNPGNGAGNISKHDGQWYHHEQCRILEADTNMETEFEVLEYVESILSEETLPYLVENLDKLSWGGLVGLYNLMFGNTYKVNGIKWGKMQKFGIKTDGIYVCSDEDMEEAIKDGLRDLSRSDLCNLYEITGNGQPEEHRVMWHYHPE